MPPTSSLMAIEAKPTMSDTLEPKITLERMSRPAVSQPSRWALLGLALTRQLMSTLFGFCNGRTLAKMAARIQKHTTPTDTQNAQPRLANRRRFAATASPSRASTAPRSASVMSAPTARPGAPSSSGPGALRSCEATVGSTSSATAHPRVDDGVEEVDQHVADDVEDRHDDRDDLDRREVLGGDRRGEDRAEAVEGEHRLYDDGARDEAAHLDAGHGHGREGRRPEGVAEQDPPRREPLRPGHHDE